MSAKHADCGKFGATTRYIMKLDVQKKSLLPDNLYATGTFAAIIELAKYYNGKPDQTSKNTTIQQFSTATVQSISMPKIFIFYRAYTK
ncbi:MAG: hypothetical protein WCL18_03015 [bacterium]